MIELKTFYTNHKRMYIFPLEKAGEHSYKSFIYFTSNDTMFIDTINLREWDLKKEEPSYRYKQEMISEIWNL